ncbi:hypothetical protein JCM10908_007058 [Rhodotorula pacifica]|uniref:uncharacterized protein n=1 Tax=Rhodotorula pacifica TaxID=1495444 RepID=UPI00317D8DA3
MSGRLMQFRAGRAVRQGDSNTVVPQSERGLVYLQEDDGLLHFCYKDLATGQLEEDLIIFPGDASFHKTRADRVHVLKFNSSSARHFFWHQDPGLDTQEFERRRQQVNQLIGSEEEQEGGGDEGTMDVEPSASAADVSMSDAALPPPPAAATSLPSAQTQAPRQPLGQAEQLAQLQNILAGLGGGASTGAGGLPSYTLPDVLPPSAASFLLSSLPSSSLSHLASFLPSGVPTLPISNPQEQRASLLRSVSSPEFRRALASLERALRTGATGPLVQGLGMPSRAAQGTEEFLQEVQRQAEGQRQGGQDQQQQEGGGSASAGPGAGEK